MIQTAPISIEPPNNVNDYVAQLDFDVIMALNIVAPLRTRTKRLAAEVLPLLKKPSVDPTYPSSYRPFSNLRTSGKLQERLAQARLRPHFLSSPAYTPTTASTLF